MNLLPMLFVGHLVGDYIFQNRWMAENKTKNILALFTHSLVYTVACFLCALPAGGISIIGALIIFVGHMILDQRSFSTWWCKHVTKSVDVPWLLIMVDQSFHFVILAVVAYITI